MGNVNLNSLGFAFRIFAATDIQTTFTIRVFDNSGGRSTHGGNIPQGSSDSGFVQFDLCILHISRANAMVGLSALSPTLLPSTQRGATASGGGRWGTEIERERGEL